MALLLYVITKVVRPDTRYGNLSIGSDGVLRTSNGLDVLDENGNQIVLPAPLDQIDINSDGYITGKPMGANAERG